MIPLLQVSLPPQLFVSIIIAILGPFLGFVLTIVIGYFLFREKMANRFASTPTKEDVISFKKELITEIDKVSLRLEGTINDVRGDLLRRHDDAIRRMEGHGAKIDKAQTDATIALTLLEDNKDDIQNLYKLYNSLAEKVNSKSPNP